IVPFQMSACTDNQSDLNRIGLLCCLSPGFRGQARYRYRTDDGCSFGYREGRRSSVEIVAEVKGRALHIGVRTLSRGYGGIHVTPYTFNAFDRTLLTVDGAPEKPATAVQETIRLTGRPLTCYRWQQMGQ
ncbi:MAG: hypothetical protein KFF50_10640, partial [Desulfatitalea sp.]|nr:hypothetical protein [Desulfatitalea sp.]